MEQKPFEKPFQNLIKLVGFFSNYPHRRQLVTQHIEQEAFRYRSLQALAENKIQQQCRINIER